MRGHGFAVVWALPLLLMAGCGAHLDSRWAGLPPLEQEPELDQDTTLQDLRKRFDADPKSDAARVALIEGLVRRGRSTETAAVLAMGMRANPLDDGSARNLLGATQMLGVPRGVVANLCRGVLTKDPANRQALWVLGELLFADNQVLAAQACLKQAWDQRPRYWRPAVTLARLTAQLMQVDESRRWCREAEAAAPGDYDAKLQLAEAYLQAAQPDRALALAREAVAAFPEDPRALAVLGQVLLEGNQPGEAATILRRALDQGRAAQDKARALGAASPIAAYLQSQQRERLWLLGRAQSSMAGQAGLGSDSGSRLLDEARASLEQAVEETAGQPGLPGAQLDLARVYQQLAENASAAAALTSAEDRAADLSSQTQDLRLKAIERYQRALDGGADPPEVYNNLAYLYAEAGHHLDEALDAAQTAVDTAPQAVTYDTLGWVYYQMANYSLALENLLRASQQAPDSPEILYHLALAYQRTGQPKKAGPLLERALELSGDKPSLAALRKRIQSAMGSPAAWLPADGDRGLAVG